MNKTIVRIGAAIAAALLPTVITYILLAPGSGLLYLILFSLVSISLSWGRTVAPKPLSRLLLVVQSLLYLFAVIVIIVSLNLTPASAYLAWFRIAQSGGATGMLSFMFAVKICFFSTFFSAMMIRFGILRPLFGLVSMALIVLYAVFQHAALGYGAMAMVAVAVMALAVRGPRRFRRRNIGAILTLSILTVAAAIPLSLLEPRRTNPVTDILDHSALSRAVISVYPDFPFLYNMPGYGHQLGNRDLGTRPSLTARPVFQVTGKPGQTVYLRTAVFDIYTGRGWAYNENRLAEAEFAYGSMFKTSNDGSFENALEIEVLIDFFSSVPHTIDTSAILMKDGEVPDLAYGSTDTGFLFELPVVKGTSFLLQQGRERSASEAPRGSHLQLPGDIPADASELARLLGVPGEPLETAARIKDYLTYNFYYTLEPSRERQFDDPAWEFLLATSEGYCVHFATSFVLLARMNGIPARYVTGFLANIPSDSNTTTVSGFSAHAWAEIWQPGVGWIVQEATPPMSPEFFDDPYFYEMYNPFQNRYTAMQLESIMGDRVSRPSVKEGPKRLFTVDPAPLIFSLVAAGLLAGMYYLAFHSIYSVGSAGRKIRVISKNMIRRGIAEGVPSPESGGWVDWSDKIRGRHPSESRHLGRSIQLMQAGFFGGRKNQRREVRFIRRTYRLVFARSFLAGSGKR